MYKTLLKTSSGLIYYIFIIILIICFSLNVTAIEQMDKLEIAKGEKIKKIRELFEKNKKKLYFELKPTQKQKEIIQKEFKPFGELTIETLLLKLTLKSRDYEYGKDEERGAVRVIFREIEEHAFPYLLKKRYEKDPYLRGGIIIALADYRYKETILALIEALDDKSICRDPVIDSTKWEPPGTTWRVCDVAYGRLLWRFGPDISYKEIREIEKEFNKKNRGLNDFEDRDIVIREFKNWWQKNKERILSKYKEFKK